MSIKELKKVDVVDIQLSGWDEYDELGLDQKGELCIAVAKRVTGRLSIDDRSKVVDEAIKQLTI